MEEERARQGGNTDNAGSSAVAPMDTEDEELARAIAMSMNEGSASANNNMNDVLQNLPGIDPNDPRVKNAMKDKSPKKDGKQLNP